MTVPTRVYFRHSTGKNLRTTIVSNPPDSLPHYTFHNLKQHILLMLSAKRKPGQLLKCVTIVRQGKAVQKLIGKTTMNSFERPCTCTGWNAEGYPCLDILELPVETL